MDDLENAINELANPEFPDKVKQIYRDLELNNFDMYEMEDEWGLKKHLRGLKEFGFDDFEDENEREKIESLISDAMDYVEELVEMYQASKKDFSKLEKLFKDFKSQVNNILND